MIDTRAVYVTPREREILNLLTQGWDNLEIADYLGMSRRTCKQHMGRLFQRFGIVDGAKRVKLVLAVLPEQEISEITLPHFSSGELQIIRLVSTGASNEEVALIRGTTTQVIKNVLRKIYDLSGSSTRLELALWVMRTDIRHSLASEHLQKREREVEAPEYARVV